MMQHQTTDDPTQKSLEAAILDQTVAGVFDDKPYAFVPVIGGSTKQWTIGVAVENESGYSPISGGYFEFDSYEKASDFCDGMNKHIGLDDYRAVQIVCSSMRAPSAR